MAAKHDIERTLAPGRPQRIERVPKPAEHRRPLAHAGRQGDAAASPWRGKHEDLARRPRPGRRTGPGCSARCRRPRRRHRRRGRACGRSSGVRPPPAPSSRSAIRAAPSCARRRRNSPRLGRRAPFLRARGLAQPAADRRHEACLAPVADGGRQRRHRHVGHRLLGLDRAPARRPGGRAARKNGST